MLQGLAILGAMGFLLMIEWFPPRWGELFVWTLLYGVPVGVGLSFWKHKNEQHKAENTEKVSICHGLSPDRSTMCGHAGNLHEPAAVNHA